MVVGFGVLLLCGWLAAHTLYYFLDGTFWYWLARRGLHLPADYEFPVSLAGRPFYGVALGILYGLVAAMPALGACMGGLWLGVVLAVVAGLSFPSPWYVVVLLAGGAVAGASWGGPRWWWRRLLAGVAGPVLLVVGVHVGGAVATRLIVFLVPAAVAVAVAGGLVALWRREVRWRSLRPAPVVVAALLLMVASPLLFSFAVTFPYHRYRLLWGRYSVSAGFLPGEGDFTPGAFGGRRGEAAARFADFARRYPGSPFAAEALCQQARLLNLTQALDSAGNPVLSEDRISAEALPVYDRLIELYPASVSAARARLERAHWYRQNARFQEARGRYRDILTTYETNMPPGYRPPPELILAGVCPQAGSGRVFSPVQKQVAYYEAYLAAQAALTFLSENGQFEAEPLRLFLSLDPRTPEYRPRLQELLLLYPEDVYPELGLLDDVHLALARGLPDEAERLERLLARYPGGDARGRTLYRLAELEFRRGEPVVAERRLRQLTGGPEESPTGFAVLEAEWARALLGRGLTGLDHWPRPFPGARP